MDRPAPLSIVFYRFMTISGHTKKTKGRKKAVAKNALSGTSPDPLAALQAVLKQEMARERKRNAAKTKSGNASKKKIGAGTKQETKVKKQVAKPSLKLQSRRVESLRPLPILPPLKAPASLLPAGTPAQPKTNFFKGALLMNPLPNETCPPLPSLPDFVDMSAQILQIAQRSHKILAAFMSRNKTLTEKIPSPDPAHLGKTFTDFIRQTLSKPDVLVEKNIAFWQDYVRLLQNTVEKLSGQEVQPVIAPDRSDKRFKDPAWQEVWMFDFIKQSYLLVSRLIEEMLQQGDKSLDPKLAHKLRFYTKQMVDAIAPTNFWMTNPEVLRTTMETHGENLVKGLQNMLDDFERGGGQLLISMSDSSVFHFGQNIATTKGKVVFQNELIQLIQFAPLTETVYKTPYLIVPPWINKYYILDLKPESSFIRYMVDQGHTVYCISWVNPDKRHAKLGFDDYMTIGPIAALKEIKRITGEDNVNCLGYCIGGTLVACMMGWMAGLGDKKPADIPNISSVTYLVGLVDFSQPGDLGVFIDEEQIAMIEDMMEGPGYLPAQFMGMTFSMLRANDLVWSFVVNNYLMGKEPFPFDLLSWNSDSTNLPAAMQSYYLRNMYLHNKLIQPNALEMKGVPIDLRKIKTPTFLLGTQEDHITLWRGVYAGTQIYSGPVTFCLSGSGHIAGVVNPPVKEKYGYWTNDTCPPNADNWLRTAEQHKGSWWPHWIKWLEQYGGGKTVPAADRDPAKNPNAIEDAPGSFVKVRVM